MQCIPLHQGCCQTGRCPADGLAGLWGLTVKAQCLSDLAVAISTRAGPTEDDPSLYKLGSKPVQAVCKGESGALN